VAMWARIPIHISLHSPNKHFTTGLFDVDLGEVDCKFKIKDDYHFYKSDHQKFDEISYFLTD